MSSNTLTSNTLTTNRFSFLLVFSTALLGSFFLSSKTYAGINEGYEPKNISVEQKAELAISDLTFSPTREGALLWLIENSDTVKNNKKLKSKALEYLSEISESHLEKKESEKKLILEAIKKIK
jgi:hypothetical protein